MNNNTVGLIDLALRCQGVLAYASLVKPAMHGVYAISQIAVRCSLVAVHPPASPLSRQIRRAYRTHPLSIILDYPPPPPVFVKFLFKNGFSGFIRVVYGALAGFFTANGVLLRGSFFQQMLIL
jgi:hypothetical protein